MAGLMRRWAGLATAVSCTYLVREGAFFLTVTFALCWFGKSASGTMHTVWDPTFQKRHQEVRKHLAKEHRRKPNSTGCQGHLITLDYVDSLGYQIAKVTSLLIFNFFLQFTFESPLLQYGNKTNVKPPF